LKELGLKMDKKKTSKDEWHYAKEREKLIKMTKYFIRMGNPNAAQDVVDAIIVNVWEHYGIAKMGEKK